MISPPSQLEKINQKKEFYDVNSIKSELLNNNTTLSASSKMLFSGQEQNFNANRNSYDEDDYNNDNIDVETDSDTDQQITELKQMNYHNLSDATVKHEEWSRIVKSTMLKQTPSPKIVERLIASANDSLSTFSHNHLLPIDPNDKKICISTSDVKINSDPDVEKCSDDARSNLKRVYLPEDDDTEYFNDSFTNQSLINLSDRKRGKYGNGKGFSIENLIGRMVEDR